MAVKRTNKDGMRYPSIDKLLEKVDSKYKLVYISSKRAQIIENEDYIAIENPRCVKSVGQALEEILEDKVKCEFKK